MICYRTDKSAHVDWEAAVRVFRRAPLGTRRREPDKLARAFAASYAVVYVFDDRRLVGMARAISDGEYQSAIYDVVLLPEYQRRGIGREMMQRLRAQLPAGNIVLFAVPGRERFYRNLGYRRMRTAMAVLRPEMADPSSGYLE